MIEIRPEPSPAEREAILIVLDTMLGATPRDEPSPRSAWALAGRREALLDSNDGTRTGWGRGSDRSADW
jgi:hypothetical protein